MTQLQQIAQELKTCLSLSNLDDLLKYFHTKYPGKDIYVSKVEMDFLCDWYLYNSGDQDPYKPEILRDGKIKKLLGVNIKEDRRLFVDNVS